MTPDSEAGASGIEPERRETPADRVRLRELAANLATDTPVWDYSLLEYVDGHDVVLDVVFGRTCWGIPPRALAMIGEAGGTLIDVSHQGGKRGGYPTAWVVLD